MVASAGLTGAAMHTWGCQICVWSTADPVVTGLEQQRAWAIQERPLPAPPHAIAQKFRKVCTYRAVRKLIVSGVLRLLRLYRVQGRLDSSQ